VSTKSKLLAKTEDLHLPQQDSMPVPAAREAGANHLPSFAPQFPGVVPGGTARTGPGQMLQFRGQMLAVEGEIASLRGQLKEHEGSIPTRKLDPQTISASQWANRHPDSFKNVEFERLKQDIALAGGNVQPICVRPLSGEPDKYEVVYGHRRHRACLELGLGVLATIEIKPISDLELFAAMDRENRERADLSPYEQGLMYRRALDAGLYSSNRRLAEALGVSHTWVSNVLSVADLPVPVLECFKTPIEVQHRHAKLIASALELDRKSVLRRAEKLRQTGTGHLAPGAVVAALVKAVDREVTSQPIEVRGRTVGSWQWDKSGRLVIHLQPKVVPEDRLDEVIKKLVESLG
jgi:ParB family chromosome partitioning protein